MMNKSRWLEEALKHIFLIFITSFATFSEYRISLGITIGYFLDFLGVPDNICGWIGFWGIPIIILLVVTGLILKSILIWLVSIPIQISVYGICWYFTYGTLDIMKCAKLVGEILVIQAVVIGIKLLMRIVTAYRKNRNRIWN